MRCTDWFLIPNSLTDSFVFSSFFMFTIIIQFVTFINLFCDYILLITQVM